MMTSPIETLTKATPTAGDTPRASLTAHTILCDSLRPKIEEAVPFLDFLPDAVPGLDAGRTVEGRDMLGLVLAPEGA